MKKYFVLVPLFLAAFGLFAQNATPKQNGPVITWEKSSHDFGDIMQGDKVEHTYVFTNTGNEPLIVTNVNVTCGCTTPKGWPKDPIQPGAKGEIIVAFNSAGKSGKVNKVVTVVSNSVGENNQVSFNTNIATKAEAPL